MTSQPHLPSNAPEPMPSAWDKIFQDTLAPLTLEEQEQALQELAQAVQSVEHMQTSRAHQRVRGLIAAKLMQDDPVAAKEDGKAQ